MTYYRRDDYASMEETIEGTMDYAANNMNEEDEDENIGDSPKQISMDDLFRDATVSDRIVMVIGALASFSSGGGSPLFMFLFGQMMNEVLVGSATRVTEKFAIIATSIGAVLCVLFTLQSYCWGITASKLSGRLRLRYFNAVLRQDMCWHDIHKPGESISRMLSNTHVVEAGIGDALANGIVSSGTVVFGYIFSVLSSWEITLLIIAGFPICAVIAGILLTFMNRLDKKCRDEYSAAASMATEVLENIKTTQVFNREDFEIERYMTLLRSSRGSSIRKQFLIGIASGVVMAIMLFAFGCSLIFAAYLIQWGRSDVGRVSSAFLSALYGTTGLGMVFPSLIAILEAKSAAYRIVETIDRIPTIDIDSTGKMIDGFKDSIHFVNVNFLYPGRREDPVFNGMNLKIHRGQKIALTGVSGSGKSTVVSMIQRFYDPTSGAVLVDGVDMRLLSLYHWRKLIGVVSQEPNLFSGTIMDNIRVGKTKATSNEVREACIRANIHETIMKLPDQYDTLVGTGQLSGGQKQRLAIARALVKKPPILLLDEATSALDRKSEIETQKALDELIKESNMTVIVIAHRLTTIRDVDCIYHFEGERGKGSRIVEWGTYDELVRQNGPFAALVMMEGSGTLKTARGLNNSFYLFGGDSYDMGHDKGLEKSSPPVADFEMHSSSVDSTNASMTSTAYSNYEDMYLMDDVPFDERAEWEVEQTVVSLRRIIDLCGNKWAFVLGTIGAMLNAVVPTIAAVIYGQIIGIMGQYRRDLKVEELQKGVLTFAPLFFALGAFSLFASIFQSFYGYAGEYITYSLRSILFRQILRQDQFFFDLPGRDPGSLSGMLSGDCELVHQLWGPSLGSVVKSFVMIGGGILAGCLFQWNVALITLACMPLIVCCMVLQQKIMAKLTASKDLEEQNHTLTAECFSSIRTITSFNMKNRMVRKYHNVVREALKRKKKVCIVAAINSGLIQFMLYGTVSLAFWYGGILIDRWEAEFQQVMIAAMAIIFGLMGAGGEISGLATRYRKAQRSAQRVYSIIDRTPDIDVDEEGDMEIPHVCDIHFQKAHFYYPSRRDVPVLDAADVYFADGTSNGLMGQTGCGKSTIVQVIARFYNLSGGRVLIDGKNLNNLDIKTWRENVSIVLQEPSLFSGTVRENILYSSPDRSEAEVEEAARVACIHEDILRMPQGYETPVGYRGRELSGGQKQRVAIARAILRKPRLLLLDEATSALDNTTEASVQRNLEEYMQRERMTTVSIAHRLATIRNCDQIVLLDAGRTVERGTHEELMAYNGEYKVRWDMTQM